ncbi:MAG: hypothetical protein HY739_10680 [Desulfobacterales bacterium]|nr:hypothetical protein [Desulfobacterales bacterium]
MNILPILVKNSQDISLVELQGHAVITARDMAKALNYKDERAIHKITSRHKKSFMDAGLINPENGDKLNPHFDTCVVNLTPQLLDTLNQGRVLRVFSKRGALKVCMKSNQPKAVVVQDMLIDLYEKVESGQLVGAARFARIIEDVTKEMVFLKKEISYLKQRPPVNINLPDDEALPIAIERKIRGRSLSKIARNKEARELAVSLLSDGLMYEEVTAELNERISGFRTSRSAVGRFWQLWRRGYLKHN